MTQKPTVLVIDDNTAFRMLVRAFLMKEDYNVTEAENGLQAMEMLEESKPNLLLLDLQMQPMGGFDFMLEYNNRGYKMPVVLITADPSSDILTRSSKLGFAGVLKKPVNEERILQIVKRFI